MMQWACAVLVWYCGRRAGGGMRIEKAGSEAEVVWALPEDHAALDAARGLTWGCDGGIMGKW
jgi:hypothetical protein